MAAKPPRLDIIVTPRAQRDLDEIWDYNSDQYGPSHAREYIEFLMDETLKLNTDYSKGKTIPGNPDLSVPDHAQRSGPRSHCCLQGRWGICADTSLFPHRSELAE